MELIAKVSKGSRMDQVYIPKNRPGFHSGSYVVVKPLAKKKSIMPIFYGVDILEPAKLQIVNEIMGTILEYADTDNVIITGSFLDEGFHFNDIDVLVVSSESVDEKVIKKNIKERIHVPLHLITLDGTSLRTGLSTDPLYQMMLSRCVSLKRIVVNVKQNIDYKFLDLHLLKSKVLFDNYDTLDGGEKYYLVRNMIAIHLFLNNRNVTKDAVDREIVNVFNVNLADIKKNMLDKKGFLKTYHRMYERTFTAIMESKRGS